jgi:hypothetical protein
MRINPEPVLGVGGEFRSRKIKLPRITSLATLGRRYSMVALDKLGFVEIV